MFYAENDNRLSLAVSSMSSMHKVGQWCLGNRDIKRPSRPGMYVPMRCCALAGVHVVCRYFLVGTADPASKPFSFCEDEMSL